jgi:hypothetical protein
MSNYDNDNDNSGNYGNDSYGSSGRQGGRGNFGGNDDSYGVSLPCQLLCTTAIAVSVA